MWPEANFGDFMFDSSTFDILNIIIWTFSPSETLFRIELFFQNLLNHPICMSKSRFMAGTLGQR